MSKVKKARDFRVFNITNKYICNKVALDFPNHLYLRMRFRINWDALGISASLACAIHCAILPMILTSLPILGVNIIQNLAFEYFMIVLAFSIGVYSLWHGYKKHHHSYTPLLVFLVGILFLIAKQVWHERQIPLLLVAVLLIVFAHLRNFRLCRVHNHAHSDDCDH